MLSLSLTPLSTMAIKVNKARKKATVRVCIKYVGGCATRQLKPIHEDGESADITTGIANFFLCFVVVFQFEAVVSDVGMGGCFRLLLYVWLLFGAFKGLLHRVKKGKGRLFCLSVLDPLSLPLARGSQSLLNNVRMAPCSCYFSVRFLTLPLVNLLPACPPLLP